MHTITQLLNRAGALASISGSAKLDTEILLSFCLQKPRVYLRTWPEAKLDDRVVEQFNTLFLRRLNGEPVAYIVGSRGFWTLDLLVDESTLIPRPETELLVEKALLLLADNPHARILDLGTGTGAIALALANEQPQWHIVACDKSPAAVALAKRNQQQHQLSNVDFICSDWFSAIALQPFDLIVSNPPYIDNTDPHLHQGDVRFEPRSALVAAHGGFADIEIIIQQAAPYLAQDAWLLIEHGYDQAGTVKKILIENQFTKVFCQQDLAGLDRISGGCC